MGAVIDNRIVEMSFENKEFERGVKETLKTLDRLEKSLKLDGAEDGFHKVAEAAKSVKLDEMSEDLDTITSQFNLLGNIGLNVLNRISNKIIDMGVNIAKAFTIDPISAGWGEYELKMNNVQTILGGIRREYESEDLAIQDINKHLDELNNYADKTIYSFAQMTANIGKFTNAGVGLEDATSAIKGISNLAAIAGAGSAENNRAMYNIAQSLSTGSMKLIDWKSLENANMATKEFQEMLVTVGNRMGKLKNGKTLNSKGKVDKKSIDAALYFRDSLQKGWLTNDVLVEALNILSTTQEGGKYTFEELKSKYGESAEALWNFAETAAKAATEVKSFSQLMDTLKEAAGSGWAQSMEKLFGGFEYAKKLWSDINNFLEPIINAMSDRRNNALDWWIELGGRDDLWNGVRTALDLFSRLYWVVNDTIGNVLAPFREMEEGINAESAILGSKIAEITSVFRNGIEFIDWWIRGGEEFDAQWSQILATFGDGAKDISYVASDNSPLARIQRILQGIGGVISFIVKIGTGFADLFWRIGQIFLPVVNGALSVAAAFGDIFFGLHEIDEESGGIADIFNILYDVLEPFATFVSEVLTNALEILGFVLSVYVQPALDWIQDNVVPMVKKIRKVVGPFIKLLMKFFSGGYRSAFEYFASLPEEIRAPLRGLLHVLKDISIFFIRIADVFNRVINLPYDQALSPLENFGRKLEVLVDGIFGEGTVSKIYRFFSERIPNAISNFFNVDTSDAETIGEKLKLRVDAFMEGLDPEGTIRAQVESIKTAFEDGWKKIEKFLFGGLNDDRNWETGLLAKLGIIGDSHGYRTMFADGLNHNAPLVQFFDSLHDALFGPDTSGIGDDAKKTYGGLFGTIINSVEDGWNELLAFFDRVSAFFTDIGKWVDDNIYKGFSSWFDSDIRQGGLVGRVNEFLFGKDAEKTLPTGEKIIVHTNGIVDDLVSTFTTAYETIERLFKTEITDGGFINRVNEFIFGKETVVNDIPGVGKITKHEKGLFDQIMDILSTAEEWIKTNISNPATTVWDNVLTYIFGEDGKAEIEARGQKFVSDLETWWNTTKLSIESKFRQIANGIRTGTLMDVINEWLFGKDIVHNPIDKDNGAYAALGLNDADNESLKGRITHQAGLIDRLQEAWAGFKGWLEPIIKWFDENIVPGAVSLWERTTRFLFGDKETGDPGAFTKSFDAIKDAYEKYIQPWLNPLAGNIGEWFGALGKDISEALNSPIPEEIIDDETGEKRALTLEEKIAARFEKFKEVLVIIRDKLDDLLEEVLGFRLFTKKEGDQLTDTITGIVGDKIGVPLANILGSGALGDNGVIGSLINTFVGVVDNPLKVKDVEAATDKVEEVNESAQAGGDLFSALGGLISDNPLLFGGAGLYLGSKAINNLTGNTTSGLGEKIEGVLGPIGEFILNIAKAVGILAMVDTFLPDIESEEITKDAEGNEVTLKKYRSNLSEMLKTIKDFIGELLLWFGTDSLLEAVAEFGTDYLGTKAASSGITNDAALKNKVTASVAKSKAENDDFKGAATMITLFGEGLKNLAEGLKGILEVAAVLEGIDLLTGEVKEVQTGPFGLGGTKEVREKSKIILDGLEWVKTTIIGLFQALWPLFVHDTLQGPIGGLLVKFGLADPEGIEAAKGDIGQMLTGLGEVIESIGEGLLSMAYAISILSLLKSSGVDVDEGAKVVEHFMDRIAQILVVLEGIDLFKMAINWASKGMSAKDKIKNSAVTIVTLLVGIVALAAVVIGVMNFMPKDFDLTTADWILKAMVVFGVIGAVVASIGGIFGGAIAKGGIPIGKFAGGMATFLGLMIAAVALLLLVVGILAEYIKRNSREYSQMVMQFGSAISAFHTSLKGMKPDEIAIDIKILTDLFEMMQTLSSFVGVINKDRIVDITDGIKTVASNANLAWISLKKLPTESEVDEKIKAAHKLMTELYEKVRGSGINTDESKSAAGRLTEFTNALDLSAKNLRELTPEKVQSNAEATAALCTAIQGFLTGINGLTGITTATRRLGTIGGAMSLFSDQFTKFSENEFTIDPETGLIKEIDTSILKGFLTTLAESMPEEEVLRKIAGYGQSAEAGENLTSFAQGFTNLKDAVDEYVSVVSGEGYDSAKMQNSADFLKIVADLAASLPASYDPFDQLHHAADGGSQSILSQFSLDINQLGTAVNAYGEAIGKVKTWGNLLLSTWFLKAVAKLEKDLSETTVFSYSSGLWSWIKDKALGYSVKRLSVEAFNQDIGLLGQAIEGFQNNLQTYDHTKFSAALESLNSIVLMESWLAEHKANGKYESWFLGLVEIGERTRNLGDVATDMQFVSSAFASIMDVIKIYGNDGVWTGEYYDLDRLYSAVSIVKRFIDMEIELSDYFSKNAGATFVNLGQVAASFDPESVQIAFAGIFSAIMGAANVIKSREGEDAMTEVDKFVSLFALLNNILFENENTYYREYGTSQLASVIGDVYDALNNMALDDFENYVSKFERLSAATKNYQGMTLSLVASPDDETQRGLDALQNGSPRTLRMMYSYQTGDNVTDLATGVVALKLDTSDLNAINSKIDAVAKNVTALGDHIDKIDVYLNTGVLVGELAGPINDALGARVGGFE